MARNPVKREQPLKQKLPTNVTATERREVEHPVSSSDTVAMDFGIAIEDGPVAEEQQRNIENKKTGKFYLRGSYAL